MEKEKEVFICFSDDNLKNKQIRIAAEYGSVMFNDDNISVTRAGYDKDFLDFVLYCDGIRGGFNCGNTFIYIPVAKLILISVSINNRKD